jgi:riboflavin biosynthesis pyrimidine reductase
VVLSRNLDLPAAGLFGGAKRRVLVATTSGADPQRVDSLRSAGAEVVSAGRVRVEARALVDALDARGLHLIYSIAGPDVLQTLLDAGVLDRIYLTTVLRVLGGERYATLVRGPRLEPPPDFGLTALYLDRGGPGGAEQLMQVYDRTG